MSSPFSFNLARASAPGGAEVSHVYHLVSCCD